MRTGKPKRLLLLTALAAVLGLLLSACGAQTAVKPAAAPAFDKLVVAADMVRGNVNIAPDKAWTVCVQNSKWARNERIVWRIKVMDPKTGAFLDDKALGQVEVKLSDGQVFQSKYGPHPGKAPTDHFWAVGWTIPDNYPSGTLNYTVNATGKDGRTSQMIDFNVSLAFLTILDAKVPIITAPAKS